MLTLDDTAVIATAAVTAITVIVMYLQLRMLRTSLRMQATLAVTEKILDLDSLLITHPELRDVFETDPMLGKDPAEIARRAYMFSLLNYFGTLFVLHSKKYLTDDEWEPYAKWIESVMTAPGFRSLWREARGLHWYFRGFEDYLDAVVTRPTAQSARGESIFGGSGAGGPKTGV